MMHHELTKLLSSVQGANPPPHPHAAGWLIDASSPESPIPSSAYEVEAARPKPPKCKCLHMFMRFHMQVIVQSDLVIYCDLLGVRLLWGAIETYTHTSHSHDIKTNLELRQPLRCVLLLALSSFLADLMLPWTKSGALQSVGRDKAETHPIWPNACPDPRSMTPE
jgi:hypothetical protein